MKQITMFGHAGSRNHGCEAIVRSTINILGDFKYKLQTNDPAGDKQYGIDKLADLLEIKTGLAKRNSLQGIKMRIQARLSPQFDYDNLECVHRNKMLIRNCDCALSIGGDNYCYGGIINSMRDQLNAFKVLNIPVVLWGCSTEKENIFYTHVIEDLKKYDLITVRESLTREVLYELGIKDSVISCSDPAFTLGIEPVKWQEGIFNNGEVIGINVSDFMKHYNAYPDATYRNFHRLIDHILKNTDYYIALIPHVVQEGNDDRTLIRDLAACFSSERILCCDKDFNCMQLKYIISKCKMFIGCRTHSTIAAYSTCVPTLVVGYSIKARGICRDIFGSEKDLLVDARTFATDNDLKNKFVAFAEQANELKNHLIKTMPGYINNAYAPKDEVLRLL